jgi:hypothetical protein
MSTDVWNVDMTDLSDALVNTLAATLANGGTFSDQRMTAEIAGNDCLADLRCKLKRAHFSRRRPSYERPTEIGSACIVARNVSETYLDLRHMNKGQIGKGYADAFCEQINEVCSTALASQTFHNDRRVLQPDTHLIEFADISVGSMDYVQCIALSRLEPRVVDWGHRIGAGLVCRICEAYVVGNQGKKSCAKFHRTWPCGKWTHEYAEPIQGMRMWKWARRNESTSLYEKAAYNVQIEVSRPGPLEIPYCQSTQCPGHKSICLLKHARCTTQRCNDHAVRTCSECHKEICAVHSTTCTGCTEGWFCMYCRTRHKHRAGGGCKQTARGEKFGLGGLIPNTPGDDTARWANTHPVAADIALDCYLAGVESMDAREAALLEPASTIAEMRRSFPQATKLDEAETKLLTLFRIRRLDVKGRQPNKIHKRSRT